MAKKMNGSIIGERELEVYPFSKRDEKENSVLKTNRYIDVLSAISGSNELT